MSIMFLFSLYMCVVSRWKNPMCLESYSGDGIAIINPILGMGLELFGFLGIIQKMVIIPMHLY